MDATGGSGSNFLVWPIVDDNGAVDMNGTMDNLADMISNLERVFSYLKNKKMLKRKENKLNKGLAAAHTWACIGNKTFGTRKPKDEIVADQDKKGKKKNDTFHWLEGLNRQLKHCKLNIEYYDHPIMTTLDIPHGLHRGKNFLESFGGSCNDPILLLMEISHMLHLEWKFFESCGSLLLVCRDDIGSTNFTIYEIFDIGSNQMDDDDDDDEVEFITPFEVDPNLYEFILSLASV
ncbi:hypothetical protein Tco_0643206 [Tanacetum coccineum]